jgi:hypothetical protein
MVDDEFPNSMQPRLWRVAFVGRRAETWFDIFSPEWARHVLAFGYVPECNCWVICNPALRRTEVSVVPDEAIVEWLTDLFMMPVEILEYRPEPGSPYSARLGNWCTTTIIRVLGIRSRALRPVALYRDLVRNGATPESEDPDVNQDESQNP